MAGAVGGVGSVGKVVSAEVVGPARRTRRAVAAALGGTLAAAFAGGLAACGPLGGGGSQPQARSAGPVSVTLYSRTAEEEAFTRRVAQFGEQHPQIELEYSPLPGDYLEVIRTHAAAGTLADVVYLQNLLFEGLAAGGSLQPVDRLVQRDRLDLKQWYESGVKALKLDGKLFGLPARGQIGYCYLFYNRDLLPRPACASRPRPGRWTTWWRPPSG